MTIILPLINARNWKTVECHASNSADHIRADGVLCSIATPPLHRKREQQNVKIQQFGRTPALDDASHIPPRD